MIRSLTPTELLIATLRANGMPTKDIAVVRNCSPKTVEAHLTNIYPKLGVRRWRDLAAALKAKGASA